jgi:hypothetical protein
MLLRTLSARRRRMLCLAMLVALALAQTLGLIHRIVHAPAGSYAAFVASSAGAGAAFNTGSTGAAAAFNTSTDWLKALFAGHASEQGCDLYDQFSHADGVPAAPAVVVLLAAADVASPSPAASRVAAQAAGFLARGPPVTS